MFVCRKKKEPSLNPKETNCKKRKNNEIEIKESNKKQKLMIESKPAEVLDLCELQENDSIQYSVLNNLRKYHGIVKCVDGLNEIVTLIDGIQVSFHDVDKIFVS